MTNAQWPPRRTTTRPARPDLEALTGLRSGKPHYYPEYRVADFCFTVFPGLETCHFNGKKRLKRFGLGL